MSRAGNSAEAGFTLLELLVVLAIIAGAATLALPSFQRTAPRLETRAVAQTLAADLRRLRSEAVARGQETRLVVEHDAHRYVAVPGPGARQLPADLELTYVSSLSGAVAPVRQQLRFRPDGSSTGGSLDLSRAGKTWRIDVDWLTGRVSLQEKL
jgi:general secretion pathway protein H